MKRRKKNIICIFQSDAVSTNYGGDDHLRVKFAKCLKLYKEEYDHVMHIFWCKFYLKIDYFFKFPVTFFKISPTLTRTPPTYSLCIDITNVNRFEHEVKRENREKTICIFGVDETQYPKFPMMHKESYFLLSLYDTPYKENT